MLSASICLSAFALSASAFAAAAALSAMVFAAASAAALSAAAFAAAALAVAIRASTAFSSLLRTVDCSVRREISSDSNFALKAAVYEFDQAALTVLSSCRARYRLARSIGVLLSGDDP